MWSTDLVEGTPDSGLNAERDVLKGGGKRQRYCSNKSR